jgi:gliding motility-associated-like protein
MFIDMVSVVPMPPLALTDHDLCDGPVLLDVTAAGATYQWSNGHASPTVLIDEPGVYAVTRTFGACSQQASANIAACAVDPEDPEDPVDPEDPIDPEDPEEPVDPEVPSDTTDNSVDAVDLVFYVPNSFTPDGDGVNDVFGVVGPQTDVFHLRIFNRWGQLVFESRDIHQKWTGNHAFASHFVPDGVYLYQLVATDDQQTVQRMGHIVAIR